MDNASEKNSFCTYHAYEVDFNRPRPLARAQLDDLPEMGERVMAVCIEDGYGFGAMAIVTKIMMPEDFHYREGESLETYALVELDDGRFRDHG